MRYTKLLIMERYWMYHFDWIKYKVHFSTPGWYAGIRITLNGQWLLNVQRSRATTYTVKFTN